MIRRKKERKKDRQEGRKEEKKKAGLGVRGKRWGT